MEEYFNKCVENMKKVVVDNEDLKEWLVTFEPDETKGFIGTQHKNIDIISQKVARDGHSGASFAMCIRRVKQELK